MLRLLLVGSLVCFTSCASTVRSVWRDWGNADLAGKVAPPIEDGVWLLPATEEDAADEAPADWRPGRDPWRLVVFLQPH